MTSTAATRSTLAEGINSMTLNEPIPRNDPYLSNSSRVSEIIDRLSLYFGNSDNLKRDSTEFLSLCISLSRGLDFAMANHQLLDRKQELPSLVKQVCRCKKDDTLLAVVMILMMSIKNACDDGWFSSEDSKELKNLAEEIAKSFCTVPNLDAESSVHLSVISTAMSRFCPRMKLGDIFFCFEAKSGSDAYVKDFLISKKKTPTEGKVRLFVLHSDVIETSSCLISPAKVNFLLNGKGVESRSGTFVDAGPQIPTVVSHFLKYGTNLLQALGEFNGNYLVAVAHTSETGNPDSSALQDYEHPAPMSMELDSELIEGPSRITLKCPISLRRIKTPVKGWSCKHTQCFDFDNYLDINSRKPSWRCPCCNQHVCFTDIRIDQKMVQVLKETNTNVTEVIVSSDWSWKAVMENDDSTKKPGVRDGKSPDGILDLTQTDDAVCVDYVEDIKHPPQPTFLPQSMTQSHDGHVVDDFWSDLYAYSFEPVPTNIPLNGHNMASTSNISNGSPILTQPFTSPTGQHESSQNSRVAPLSQSVDDPLLMLRYQFGNPLVSNEFPRVPNPYHQSLPVQTTPTSAWHPAASSHATTGVLMRPPVSTRGGTSSQSLHQYQPPPSQDPYNNLRPSEHPSRIGPAHRMHRSIGQNPYSTPRSSLQSVQVASSSRHHPTGFSLDGTTYTNTIAAANRTAHMFAGSSYRPNPLLTNPNIHNTPGSRTPSPRDNVGVSSQSIPTINEVNDHTEQNWRASARMRGALSGQAYADAFNQFIVQPSQQAQAVRPIPNVNASSATHNMTDHSNRGPHGMTMHGGSGGFTQ